MFEKYVLTILLFMANTNAYNFEERLPLIKRGPSASLFGFSVALHHRSEESSTVDDALLLIGAPTTNASNFHSTDSVKPGALFSCQVSSNQNDCHSIQVDNSANTLEKNNSNQWLGVAVVSEKPGGLVAVCAHRFMHQGHSSSRGIIWESELGRCYILSCNLTLPTISSSIISEHVPCEGKDSYGSYSQAFYGYCQAGTSVAFANNTNNEIIVSVPGMFHWTGGFESIELSPNEFFYESLWNRDENTKDAITSNSYNGFSVAVGNIFGSSLSYVSGAPRANDTGCVVIYEKHNYQNREILQIRELLHGETLASAFGYDVKILDITGDGRLDIIVGAPQYYDREKMFGGAVYIYVNMGLSKIGPNPTTILYGDPESSFGISITNLGDINMDGVNDFAVGAPGADNGAGAVYIYNGNADPNVGALHKPSQILRGKTLNESHQLNIVSFGYSLSGGLDIDFNGYPDLLVGSLSDLAVLYRSRPIIDVKATITPSLFKVSLNPIRSPNAAETKGSMSNETHKIASFNLTLCMNYTSFPLSFNRAIKLKYTIKLDTENNEMYGRATFIPYNYGITTKTGVMKLFPQSQARRNCNTFPVYLDNAMQDKLSPLVISANYDVLEKAIRMEKPGEIIQSLNRYPVLNKDISNTTSTQVNISKNCGLDDICQSNLLLAVDYVMVMPQSDTWKAVPLGKDKVPELPIGTEKALGIRFNATNNSPGEDAHRAMVKIMLPNILSYSSFVTVSGTGATVTCSAENKTVIICDIGNPFLTDSFLSWIVKLSDYEGLYDVHSFHIDVKLSTSSSQEEHGIVPYPASVLILISLTIDGFSSKDQIPFSGEVIGESAVREPSDAGLLVDQEYEIINLGKSTVHKVFVNVSWPQMIKNGKWLFYLLSADVLPLNNRSQCNLPNDQFNPLKLPYNVPSPEVMSNSSQKRGKRGVKFEQDQEGAVNVMLSVPNPSSLQKRLKCPYSAQCMDFRCDIGSITPGKKVYIKLTGVVWNSTFIEEYYGVGEVQVHFSARMGVEIPNAKCTESCALQANTFTSILSKKVLAPEEQVKVWIIVVATIAGVLLLLIIVLLLWKCGFFKRHRDYGDYHKAQRHRQASQKFDDTSDRMLY